MCIFKAPRPAALPGQPAIQPRQANEQAAKGSKLPEKKDLLDPDESADVAYGSRKKLVPGLKGIGHRGARALHIPLNPGTASSSTGGLNV